MKHIFFSIIVIALVSCGGDETRPLNSEVMFLSFKFVGVQAEVEIAEGQILALVHFKTNVTALKANFEVSEGAKVYIGEAEQESGRTLNDFSNPVTFKVVSEDGETSTEWLVTVEKLPEPPYSVSTLVSDFPGNDGISVDSDGNIYVNSNGQLNAWNGTTLYKVTPSGSFELFASNLPSWPVGSEIVGEKLLVTGWNSPGIISEISLTDGSITQLHSGVREASGIEIDANGNLYVMEPPTNSIVKFDADGNRSVLATGSPLNGCSGITLVESSNEFFITNWNNGVISKVTLSGEVSFFATLPVSNLGPIMNDGEYLYVTSYNFNQVFSIKISDGEYQVIAGTGTQGNTDGYGDLASFNKPLGIGMSPDGEILYVSEVSPSGSGRLRMIKKN